MPDDVFYKIDPTKPIRLGSAIVSPLFPIEIGSGVYAGRSFSIDDIGIQELQYRFFDGVNIVSEPSGTVVSPSGGVASIFYSPAGDNRFHGIFGLQWSYSNTPTSGGIRIFDGSQKIFDVDITSAGPGFFNFEEPKTGSVDTEMQIILSAGGSGVVGKLNSNGHFIS